jgi:hypothetical protein
VRVNRIGSRSRLLRCLRALAGSAAGASLLFDRAEEPIQWRKNIDPFSTGRRCTAFCSYRSREEEEGEGEGEQEKNKAYQEKRNFSFDASIWYSFISRARAREGQPKETP